MRRVTIISSVALILFLVLVSICYADMTKEGPAGGTRYLSGTFKVLAMEKERIQMNYEATGICSGSDENSPYYMATVHVLGSFQAVKGVYEDDRGLMVVTRPDGDKIFHTYAAKGRLGVTDGSVSAKGTFTILGGTGKCAGIQGGGEFERHSLKSAAPGTFQSFVVVTKGSYKIP